ncbi:MAG TPA: hypothetical protein VEC06_12075 [Paucimonas sp.]|nr:hypothetical protein [Paucimonas sp.]
MHGPTQPQRRKFFKIASAGTLASTAVGIPSLLVSSQAQAEELLGKEVFSTLVKIARDIFPHDRFGDEPYAKAVADYSGKGKEDPALRNVLIDGVKLADAAAKKQHRKGYAELADEKARVAILTTIQDTPSSPVCAAPWWSACITSRPSGQNWAIKVRPPNTAVISIADSTINPGWTRKAETGNRQI